MFLYYSLFHCEFVFEFLAYFPVCILVYIFLYSCVISVFNLLFPAFCIEFVFYFSLFTSCVIILSFQLFFLCSPEFLVICCFFLFFFCLSRFKFPPLVLPPPFFDCLPRPDLFHLCLFTFPFLVYLKSSSYSFACLSCFMACLHLSYSCAFPSVLSNCSLNMLAIVVHFLNVPHILPN